jgi:hypothetical protein
MSKPANTKSDMQNKATMIMTLFALLRLLDVMIIPPFALGPVGFLAHFILIP